MWAPDLTSGPIREADRHQTAWEVWGAFAEAFDRAFDLTVCAQGRRVDLEVVGFDLVCPLAFDQWGCSLFVYLLACARGFRLPCRQSHAFATDPSETAEGGTHRTRTCRCTVALEACFLYTPTLLMPVVNAANLAERLGCVLVLACARVTLGMGCRSIA